MTCQRFRKGGELDKLKIANIHRGAKTVEEKRKKKKELLGLQRQGRDEVREIWS